METLDAASCLFFTPGDACRLALDAYRDAVRDLQPPNGEPWIVDGSPYATPADFVDAFADDLAARLGMLALDRLGEFRPPMNTGNPYVRASLVAPEKMAEIIAARETEMRQAEAEIIGSALHSLPAGENAAHNAIDARASDER